MHVKVNLMMVLLTFPLYLHVMTLVRLTRGTGGKVDRDRTSKMKTNQACVIDGIRLVVYLCKTK